MTPFLYRLAFVVGLVALLEVLCLTGVVDPFSMQAPHLIVRDLYRLLASGELNGAIAQSFQSIVIAFVLAMAFGIASALLIHRVRRLREALEPFFATYYAIPVLAFYPLMIVLFGLGPTPQILIAVMFAAIAVVVTTLDGLDRVPRVYGKVARVSRLGALDRAWHVTLPCIAPYLLTAAKLAVTYSIIGIIASEFIMSGSGLGYEINFAYINFDNATMYPLILLILVVAISVNAILFTYEKKLMRRRGMKS
jgi:NitT/TauT family transport system permease protein